MKKNNYLSGTDIAKILEVSPQAINSWLRKGEIKYVSIGHLRKVRAVDLLEYLKNLGNSSEAMAGFKKDIENYLKDKAEIEQYLNGAKDKAEW